MGTEEWPLMQNDRHERLVKLSRDVTIGSKRLIFLLQRNDDRDTLLKQAEADLSPILANLEKIALELQGTCLLSHSSSECMMSTD